MELLTVERYAWKRGAIPVKPATAAQELHRIAERDGDVSPAAVVKAATPKGAPLHPAFEWDNKKAAELYREDQARYLMRQLVVVYRDAGGEQQQTRAMVRLTVHELVEDEDEPAGPMRYLPIQRVLADEGMTRDYIAQAREELRAFQSKYRDVQALASTVAAIDPLVAQLVPSH